MNKKLHKYVMRIEQKTGESEIVRYQYDNHLGSACLELDDAGQIISYEEYHPFGTTSYRSGRSEMEVSLKRYKYCGKERDEGTGLYYYGMRYYAAWLCRFVSVDPLKEERVWVTPYNYCQNNPVTRTDQTGALDDEPPKTKKLEPSGKGTVDDPIYTLGNITEGTYRLSSVTVTPVAEGMFSWLDKTIDKIGDWFKSVDFVVELSGDISVGLQASVRGNAGGVIQGTAEFNIASIELFSGKVDFTELGSEDSNAGNVDYVGKDGVVINQGVGVTGGAFGYDIIGAEIESEFRTHGMGYEDHNVNYGGYFVVPVFKSKSSKSEKRNNTPALNPTPNATVGAEKKFRGIDIGVGVAFILGFNIDLKIGVKY
jgi:RHS repeat-associated protein